MANATTMTVTLKAVSDFSDVKTNVSQLKNAFSQLKLPSDLKGQFSNIFSGLEKDVSKASEMMSKGFRTTGDVSKFETVVDKISKGFRELQAAASEVSPDMVLDSFTNTPELENAISKLKELTKAWEDLRTSGNNDATKKIEDALKSLGNVSKNKSIGKFQEAFDSLDFSKMEQAFAELRKGEDYFADGSKNGQIYKDTMEELGKAFEQIKVSPELKDLGRQLQEAGGDVNKLSEEGRNNLLRMIEQLIGKLPQASDEVDKLGKNSKSAAEDSQELSSSLQSFANKAKYFLGLENAVRLFKRAVREAFETVKELDAVMTETAVVTEFDVGDMWKQLPEYTARAKELGVGLKDAYESATIFYQQGLNTAQVNQLSTETLKMARIAGLDAAEATDRMTNALRGFNMELNQTNAQRVSDVYSKLAAITASDTDEISTAMTKIASLANSANMSFESTAAFLSQIIETTRESAETAGTALKTVVARFSEVKKLYSEGELTGIDAEGEEIDVNRVSAALRTAGIDLNEFITGAKGLDDIFMELASKWDSLTLVQQRYIATMAAGSRQQSRFIALMSNYDRTLELVEAANNANGAANEQYGKTLESLQSKLNNLKTSWETFLMGIANNEAIKAAIDLLTKLLDIINKITSGSGAWQSFSKIGISLAAFDLGKIGLNKIIGKVIENSGGKLSKSLKGVFGDSLGKGFGETFKDRISKITTFLQGHGKKWTEISKKAAAEAAKAAANAGGEITESASMATGSIKEMGKALIGVAAAHPVLAGIVVAITAIVAANLIAIKVQQEHIEKAEKAYEEAKQELEETNSKLDEYSQKLSTAKERLSELKGLKTDNKITLTQETELKNLETQTKFYEAQIKLLERKKELKEQEVQETGANEYKERYINDNIRGLKSKDSYLKEYMDNFDIISAKAIAEAQGDAYEFTNAWIEGASRLGSGHEFKSLQDVIDYTYKKLDYAEQQRLKLIEEGKETPELDAAIKSYQDFLDKYSYQLYEEASQLTYQTNPITDAQRNINEVIEHGYDQYIKYLFNTGDSENITGAYQLLLNAPWLNQGKNGVSSYLENLSKNFDNTETGINNFAEALSKAYAEGSNPQFNNLVDAMTNLGLLAGTDINGFKGFATQLLTTEEMFNSSAAAASNWAYRVEEAKTARDSFEAQIKTTESGTENFESYSDSYKKYMELVNAGYGLGNKQLAAYAERLVGSDKLVQLNGDIDQITDYIRTNLGGVFSNTESEGAGLLKRMKALSNDWIQREAENGKKYRALLNENHEEVAKVYEDGSWFIDTENGLSDVAKAFGMTNEEVIACIQAIGTWQTVITESVDESLDFLREHGAAGESDSDGVTKVYKAKAMLEWAEEGKSVQESLLLLQQLEEDENVVVVDVELTGDKETDFKKLFNPEEGEEGLGSYTHRTGRARDVDVGGYTTYNVDEYQLTAGIDSLTAAYAYANLSVSDFLDTFTGSRKALKDNEGNIISNNQVLESLIKSYSKGKTDLEDFYKTVTINGKSLDVLNVKSLTESLKEAGVSKENIDQILQKLNSEGHFIDFAAKVDWSQVENINSTKDSLAALGLGKDLGDGNFQVDVEAVAKFAFAEGYSPDEVKAWINSLTEGTDASIQLSVDDENVEATIDNAYITPLDEAKIKAQDVADNLNKINTQVAQNAMADLTKSMEPAITASQSIYDNIDKIPSTKSITISYKEIKKKLAVGKSEYDNYSGVALTGEEGPELRLGNGYAEVLGVNGPQLTHVDKDDVIYPADQTKKILSKGPQKGAFPRFAGGGNIDADGPGDNPGGGGGGGSGNSSRTTSSSSSSSGAQKAAEKSKEAWDKFYKYLKHQREMDEINDAQYYAALEANYRNYLDTSEENLDTWNSVVEEIYKGNYSTLTKAWNDELSEWDHKIAMEQATEADKLEWMKNNNEKYLSDNIQQHKDYQKALEDIHKGEIDAQKNAFNEGKEALEHALAMNLISEKEYYKKVDELAQKTLVGNQKEIIKERQKNDEDMHKHEIDTQKDAWSKRQAELQHELEMGKTTQEQYWKDYAASYKEILVSNAKEVTDERLDAERELQKGIRDLEKQTFEERLSNWERLYNAGNVKQKEYLAGLTRTLNTEYIQWRSLSEDEKKEKEQALFDVSAGYEDMASNNASALEKMHDLVVKQIQSEKKAEMEAIDVKIKDLKAVADARKQAIDDIEKENDYLKEQRGLQKTAAQLEAELEMMKSDTSAAGMAKRRKLEAQLAAQKEKIADSEHKHSVEAQKDQIDKQTQMQTDALEAQKKAIEDYTNNEAKISEDAWIKMNVAAQSEANMSKFFDDLTNWAKKAGLDIQDEISTTVAGFETAMDESQNNFINSMAAYEEAGLGPREMLQSLADSGVDVSKVLAEMDEMDMGNEWSDDVKGLLATRLQAKGVTNEQVASAAQASAGNIDLNEGMGQKTALDMAAQMEGVGLGWEEAQEALNKYMAAQGRDVQLSAKGWRDLALQLTDNNVSMADLSSAMHTYGKDTEEWIAATSKVDDSVKAALILKAKYGEVQTSINSMKSAYGAYEMDMLASGQKVIPAVDSFTTRATQIVENGALTVDQKLEALQTETEERWDNSTFGQITAEQQATIDANLQKLKDDYGLSDTQIQAGWDAVKNGVMTPEELAEASTKLLELGDKYSLSDQQIQDGWKAVTSGQLSETQLENVDTSLETLKGKYDLSNQTIGGLWNQVTAGTLTPQQLENARLSCVELEKKFSTSKDTINGIWGQIANGQLNATDFTTFSTKLDGLATKTDTDKKTINTLLGQVASGAIDGTKLPAVTGIIGGLDKIYESGLADANNTNTVLNAIATGKIDPNKLNAVNDIVGLLGTIPAGADGARKLVNEALSNIAKGKDVDISALKKKTEEMQEELMDVTGAANNADLSVKSIGTGKQTITADTEGALKARAALRAASKLDTYTDEEMKYLDADGDGKVTAADARIWLRRGAKLEGYASGTSSVPSSGIYRIDEDMQDELIYDPTQNALLSYLNKKSIVFPADVSRTMKQLFFNPDLLSPSISAPSAPSMEASINNTTCGDIHMGDIVINGNTDQKTIAQIRAEQKRQARYIGDIFERDQRFMTNI